MSDHMIFAPPPRPFSPGFGPCYPPPRQNLLWAAVDFDGTLAEGIWTPENPTNVPGAPIRSSLDKLQYLVREGYKIVIHTARPWSDYEMIEYWLEHYGVPWNKIVCGKLLAHIYIDDRACHVTESLWALP